MRGVGADMAADLLEVDRRETAYIGRDLVQPASEPQIAHAATVIAGVLQRHSPGADVAIGRLERPAGAGAKVEGKDDETGEALIQRDDDKEDTVKKRLDVYSSQTRPLVDYYSGWAKQDPAAAPKYRAISGTGTVEEITTRALAALAS